MEGKTVIRGASLSIDLGDVAFLFGPNASGKTSLVMSIIGHPKYRIVSGRIIFYSKDITNLSMEQRVQLGITSTFQFPPTIKGVRFGELARELAKRYSVPNYIFEEFAEILNVSYLFDRDLNVGFSGGERRRAEIFLVAMQAPKFVIFDEPDSGVDPVSIELIGRAINKMMEYGLKGSLIISHSGALVKFVKAVKGFVMINGTIVCEGDPKALYNTIVDRGFEACRGD